MDIAGEELTQEGLQNLLMQYKYLDVVKRVTRGVAHSYNNIFTGLGGQTALLQQESAFLEVSVKRSELIGDLLRRGIEQTAILSGFARDADTDSRSHSPLGPATKAVELLNCISRVHRFRLVSKVVQQERFVCNLRDVVLLLFYLGENCVDATPDGGEVVLEICREETEAGRNPPGLVFRFLDHGPGFSESVLTSPNNPFITNKNDSPNRGLGLYAARILAERHHGFLTIARTEANQTVVGAVFPLAVEETQAETPAENAEKENRRRDELGKQCFLVVEDDEAMRTLLLNRLQRRGHMVFCVDTCTEGLEEYRQLNDIITIVLMDVGLRDTSGYECYRKMLTVNPRARIIFMSGQDEMIPAAMAGNTIFLQKPFTIDQLETAVRDVHL